MFDLRQDVPERIIDLAERYAYPEIAPASGICYTRASMSCSIDGASTRDDHSLDHSAGGNIAITAALRGLSDAIVVGSRTLATENYAAIAADSDFIGWRSRRRQRTTPVIVAISAALNLDPAADVWKSPGAMVFTCRNASQQRREALRAVGVRVVSCGEDTVDLKLALEFLAGTGLWRILVEGGPTLLGQFVRDDVLDELCLTVNPNLYGGPSPRILSSATESIVRMRPLHVLTDVDNNLYTRWVRR
ncbi:dihydrofolate reductase family protein [Mycolicibacterium chlorophenolicum]|uniref:Riboflavin biosynthesis protein RibD n=1 Tax=Mycolicibacterium chlorophenolicum TaxID=37916 RepID=A0A0J6ZFS8_9MYCO|nr:dihydrofolate reductase family protein [Mycolicibacterium chlorophenolicum]KMO83651.1 Riboflavin biosynthesis protein RibD [Mycolicibacterium chlorophenolicum]